MIQGVSLVKRPVTAAPSLPRSRSRSVGSWTRRRAKAGASADTLLHNGSIGHRSAPVSGWKAGHSC